MSISWEIGPRLRTWTIRSSSPPPPPCCQPTTTSHCHPSSNGICCSSHWLQLHLNEHNRSGILRSGLKEGICISSVLDPLIEKFEVLTTGFLKDYSMKYSSINPVSCVYKINSLLVRMTCMTYRASTGLQRNNKISFNKLFYLCEICNTTALLYPEPPNRSAKLLQILIQGCWNINFN